MINSWQPDGDFNIIALHIYQEDILNKERIYVSHVYVLGFRKGIN